MRPSLIAFACSLVVAERLRQINEKGYGPDHDDEHGGEELATAAAMFLLPASLNPDVAYAFDDSLRVESLLDMLGAQTFDVHRDDPEILDSPPAADLDERIATLTYGLALGMAELERILRLRHPGELRNLADGDGLLANRFRQLAADMDRNPLPEGP